MRGTVNVPEGRATRPSVSAQRPVQGSAQRDCRRWTGQLFFPLSSPVLGGDDLGVRYRHKDCI